MVQRSVTTLKAEEYQVSFQTPLPGPLFEAMGKFIDLHPQWDQYRLLQAALAGFLLQQGEHKSEQQRELTRRYVGCMFGSLNQL
nr:DUF2811 domain-containing protein [Synechococcus lacustris]